MITEAELSDRRARLRERALAEGATGYVLFGPEYVNYFTGFWFLPNERPIVFAESAGGESLIFVPEFEVERTKEEASFERIESYPEYPGLVHPMAILSRLLADVGIRDRIAADQDGYPGILGYQGPPLGEVTGATVVAVDAAIEQMLRRKSPAEIELIRESGRWCSYAHRLLQEYSLPGATEAEVSLRVAREATLAMLAELGDSFRGQLGSADGVKAGYRGQIGRRSAWAHAIAHDIVFQPGDLLVSETGAPVWGYNAELERGLVIGPPSDRVKWLFEHTVASQEAAFAAIRPGATCADVDGAVMRYFEQHDLLPYWRQHTGHGIGLRNHEAPFLDVGDHTVLEPGMVFTIEPGLYDSELGGVRHSDTIVVTEDGMEKLTDYPSDLESLTIPV
ncbi:MAG TPA: Xaa-Pro peptidase family protein [Gaiellaceae bacterium]|nr:Xaa-Pro peptidase family protein [Gaiellaceae bacterium]